MHTGLPDRAGRRVVRVAQNQHIGQQIGGQAVHRRMLERKGRRQRTVQRTLQLPAQLQRHQRVHPQVGKACLCGRQDSHAQHACHKLLQIARQP